MEALSYTIKDENGIHARPAGLIVNHAKAFDCNITLKVNGKEADAKGIFSVMKLAAKAGDVLTVEFSGADEIDAKNSFLEFLPKNI